jgi:DNA-binding MarR family transcriptional regulator
MGYILVVVSEQAMCEVARSIEALAMWLRRQTSGQVSSSTVTSLDSLASAGPLRISELAEREAISQPGMTTLVNRLEGAGLAERIPDPTDGRATLVRITDRGRQLLADRGATRTTALLAEFERLDDEQRAALVAALPAVQALITGKKKVS